MPVLDAFHLSGQVALVTGGSRGLGEAFALALAEAGADVALLARDGAASQRSAERIRAQCGVRTFSTAADVSVREDVERAVSEATDALGPIDILVNNAGICIHKPALEVSDDEWRRVLDVNVTGVWQCSQAVGRRMVERGQGVIINIGSLSGLIVNRPQWQPAYNASKAAVHQLTKSLAGEWAPHGVRVNALAPGYIKTDMASVDDPQYHRYWIEDAAMQRYALPEELGPSLVYLAGRASSFMTGHILVVDGGYSIW